MEKVARGHEAPLKHSRDTRTGLVYTSSFRIDQDLLTRIRSLLVARNEQYPPKTPLPSPDYSFSPSNIHVNNAGYFPEGARPINFNSIRAVAKLARAQSRESSMVSNTFDGPAGQLEDPYNEGVRRHPSHPNMHSVRSLSMDHTPLQTSFGLNQRVPGEHIGRDHRKSVDSTMTPISHVAGLPQAMLKKQRQGTQTPHFVLRTVPPATPQSTEKRLGPGPHHVPGSYKSEIDRSSDTRSRVASPSVFDSGSMAEDDDSWTPQSYYESRIALSQGAIDALTKTIDHDSAFLANRLVRSIRSRPSLRERPSRATLMSHTSVKQLHHLLLKPSADQLTTSTPVEPILTSGIVHVPGHDLPEAPLHAVVGHHSAEHPAQLKTESTQENSQGAELRAEELEKTNEAIVELNGPYLPDVHAQLPPFKQEDVVEFEAYHLIMKSAVSSEVALTKGSTPSHHSRGSSLDSERGGTLSQLRLALGEPETTRHLETQRHALTAHTDTFLPLSDGDVSSRSTKSRTVSALSENASRDAIRNSPVNTSTKDTRDAFVNDTTYLQKSSSLHSGGCSVDTDESVHTRGPSRKSLTLQERPYQIPGDLREAIQVQQPEPRKHWISQLLGRRSMTSGVREPTTLTARPYHRQRHVVNAAHHGRAQTMPMRGLSDAVGDENEPYHSYILDSNGAALSASPRQVNHESFAKVIRDLEVLLGEAIIIARQGAEGDRPTPVGGSPALSSENYRSSIASLRALEEQHQDTVPPERNQSESEHLIISESEERNGYPRRFNETHDATPYPADSVVAARHPSATPGEQAAQPPVGAEEAPDRSFPNLHQSPASRCPSFMPQFQPMSRFSGVTSATAYEDEPVNVYSVVAVPFDSIDWATRTSSIQASNPEPAMSRLPVIPRRPTLLKSPTREQLVHVVRERRPPPNILIGEAVRNASIAIQDYSSRHQRPPIEPRTNSEELRTGIFHPDRAVASDAVNNRSSEAYESDAYVSDWHEPGRRTRVGAYTQATGEESGRPGPLTGIGLPRQDTITSMRASEPQTRGQEMTPARKGYSLRDRHHFSIREHHGFSLSRSHRRAPIARDWNTPKKRFVAAVTCISTALLGLIVGIYTGEVPAIQYAIVDEHHYTILGNVVFYAGLAIPTALLWPLPLLYGRKPFTLAALALLIPLQFPQAIVVGTTRSPYVATYRTSLLLTRAISGLVIGFANINFIATLLDLFGASLQSGNPHQEMVNEDDVRRHGGGMGIWLGIWTWCFIGSIGVGFLIGALVISGVNVSWGFYIAVILTAIVLLLNILTPEVRRSPYRRSMAEVRDGSDVSRRIARGEIKMHLQSTGPKWWWEEVVAGNVLCLRMLKQPGFLVLSLYLGWIYGQIVILIVVSDASFLQKSIAETLSFWVL